MAWSEAVPRSPSSAPCTPPFFPQGPQKVPGNFVNPFPWFDDYSDGIRARELNNGRIAMPGALPKSRAAEDLRHDPWTS